jgi:hypothetical protein
LNVQETGGVQLQHGRQHRIQAEGFVLRKIGQGQVAHRVFAIHLFPQKGGRLR